jgi:predicted metal-dependent phosphoesterase TrpH
MMNDYNTRWRGLDMPFNDDLKTTAVVADLHCHTHISDNSFTTREVIQQAKQAGITHLAITNHDTTMGLNDALVIGQQNNVHIIPGIEISAKDSTRGKAAHVLGYFIKEGNPQIEHVCGPTVKQRHAASILMVQKVRDLGYDVSWEAVEKYARGGSAVYKQHIMHALMDLGYCDSIYGPLHDELFSRSKSNPGKALVRIEYPEVADAIRAIRAAGGVAVLAHPGQQGILDAVEEYCSYGLQGLEVFHAAHDESLTKQAWALAEQLGLAVTGGADYHGAYGSAKLALGRYTVGAAEWQRLVELRAVAHE